MLLRLLNQGGLSPPLFAAEGDTSSGGADTTSAGAGQEAPVTVAAGSSDQAADTVAAGTDTVAAGETAASDWRVRRIAELTGQNSKNKQRIVELEQLLAQQKIAKTPAGEASGKTYTDDEIAALVTERATNMSAYDLYNTKCNDTARAGFAAYSDFQAKLDTLKAAAPLVPDFMEQAWEIGNAHDIIYELGKDPARGQEIMAMRPTQRAVALAKLVAEVEKKPKVVQPSKAPPPNPTRVGTQGTQEKDLTNIQNMDDWVKERTRQVDERTAARRKK